MRASTWKRVKNLYADACELPLAQRRAFLESRAAMDPLAASEALRLLRADDLPVTLPDPIRALPGGGRLHPGQTLANRFLVRRFVAAGGFGEVYEAEDTDRAERVALKIFRAEYSSPDHVVWLRREVDMARRVRHPNVCRVHDVHTDGGLVFLTMEFLDGETLGAWLRREGALTERRALPLVRQIVAGLAAAHDEGVIHRDLKPGNVMIVPRPDGPPRAVLTDFGMARASQDHRRTTVSMQSSAAFGTPAYMAPEQVSGAPAGREADVYALGVVLHELLTGELPFSDESPLAMAVRKTRERPESPRRYAPSLRRNWDAAILRCLEPQPAKRFRDVREVLAQLESRSVTLLRAKIAWRTLRRQPAWAAAVALLAAGVAAWQWWPSAPKPEIEKVWTQGVTHLHAGEPLEAIKTWATVERERLPARAPVDAALAWHALGAPERARRELERFSSWRGGAADRRYAEAAWSILSGRASAAQAILNARADGNPHDALIQADAGRWARAAQLRAEHGGAHLRLAEEAARAGDWLAADREYLLATTWFQTQGQKAMVRAVASRRGLRRLEQGDLQAAKLALLPGASIPGTGAAPCERYVILQSGLADAYQAKLDPVAYVSPRFKLYSYFNGHVPPQRFNHEVSDQPYLAVSFPLPDLRFCSAQMEIRMRRDPRNPGSLNDQVVIGAAPFDAQMFPPQTHNLWAQYPGAKDVDFTIELKADILAAVQRAYAGEPVASLDLLVGDDTDLDYVKLTLVY